MTRRRPVRLGCLATALAAMGNAQAVSVYWDNGSGDSLWNTNSINWSSNAWNNAAGNVAVFDITGTGPITVPGAVTAQALNFAVAGYSLSGTGSITLAPGTTTSPKAGTIVTGWDVAVDVQVPVHSNVGLTKLGNGTLTLGTQNAISGSIPLFVFEDGGAVTADVLIGGISSGYQYGGTLALTASNALPATTDVAIGYGYLDVGTNSVTVKDLIFTNHSQWMPWNTTVNANNGVIGSGTLQVTGDIHVFGQHFGADNYGNAIAANVDLGGRTQMIRIGRMSSFGLETSLMFTGAISNGSIYKTYGYGYDGSNSGSDGMALYANNTYTGATLINGGNCVATGTNATTDVKLVNALLTLQGENGSMLSAPEFKVIMDSTLQLDSTRSVGASGLGEPNIPAGVNNNRIGDTAHVILNSGTFDLIGMSGAAVSETIGSLSVQGGHNGLGINDPAGGSVTLTANNGLMMASRSTLQINNYHFSPTNGETLGTTAKLILNGTVPAADATGILPRVIAGGDFATYDPVTGINRYTGYAADFSTPGTNVSLPTSTSLNSSQTINALKAAATISQGNLTLTINSGAVLSIQSGMILNPQKYFINPAFNMLDDDSGTLTIDGDGTIAFGNTPGVLFTGGNTYISAAMTGSQGLINAHGSSTLSGNLSGLSGTMSVNSGVLTLASPSFAGPIEVLNGELSMGAGDLAGSGDIRLGNPANDIDMLGAVPRINLQAAGNNAVFNRNIIVDNVTKTIAGNDLEYWGMATLVPLENYYGTQTLNGNLTLNTSLNFQGGAGGASGATIFNGAISGPGMFCLSNGNVVFSSSTTVTSTGGFLVVPLTGWAGQLSFLGTANSTGTISITGGTTGTPNSVRYLSAGSLPTGTITFLGGDVVDWSFATVIPLSTSTISNPIVLAGHGAGSVGTSITATWAGDASGAGTLRKQGNGTLILAGSSAARTGDSVVAAGTLQLNNDGTRSAWSPVLTGPGGAEVKSGRLVFAYSGSTASPASIIEPLMMAGYANGTFNSATNRIRRLEDVDALTTLGWMDTGSSVVVGYTFYGDGNLDGKVNTIDFNYLAGNFGITAGGTWHGGDYNYDDAVNSLDFNRLASTYGQSMATSAPALGSVVPEPTLVALPALVAFAVTRRRRD